MSRTSKERQPIPIFWMRWTRRFRQYSRRWALKRTLRRLSREQSRLLLMQLLLDEQLLLVKELQEREQLLQWQTQEAQASLAWRVKGELPPPEEPDPLDQLLGL